MEADFPFHTIETEGIKFTVVELRPQHIRLRFEFEGDAISVFFRYDEYIEPKITILEFKRAAATGLPHIFHSETHLARFLQYHDIRWLSSSLALFDVKEETDDDKLREWYPLQGDIFMHPLRTELKLIREALITYGL